jgi:lipopolysaccharide/colanic/teichoic acid biosynthesis glycosyltransferase
MRNRITAVVKRIMDIVLSIIILIVNAPIAIAIAIAIKLTSPGPVFYRQRRLGRIGPRGGPVPEFNVYKFRTMTANAEASTGAVLCQQNDPRVTRIGHFLRKTRLDELPQFLNVLNGDMSIVGPRPERPELMEPLNSSIPFFEERLRFVKPGITGLAQIKLNYDGDIPQNSDLTHLKPFLVNPFQMQELEGAVADGMRLKLLYDLVYSSSLERFSSFIKTDLGIMLKTPLVMFYNRTGQ